MLAYNMHCLRVLICLDMHIFSVFSYLLSILRMATCLKSYIKSSPVHQVVAFEIQQNRRTLMCHHMMIIKILSNQRKNLEISATQQRVRDREHRPTSIFRKLHDRQSSDWLLPLVRVTVVDISCAHFDIIFRSLLSYIFAIKLYYDRCLFRIVCGDLSSTYCFFSILYFCMRFWY